LFNILYGLIEKLGTGSYTSIITYTLSFLAIIIICFAIKLIVKIFMIKTMTTISKKTKYSWDNILLKNKFFHKLSWVAIPFTLSIFVGSLPNYNSILEKTADILFIILFVVISSSFINSIEEIYRAYEVSKVRPIKGMLQVVKVILTIISVIILISLLLLYDYDNFGVAKI